MTLLIIAIYLLGYVCSYIVIKYTDDEGFKLKKPDTWVVAERSAALLISLLSWAIVLCWIIASSIDGIEKALENDKAASW
jgi:hypothetical protein